MHGCVGEMKSPVFAVIDGLSELENDLKWEEARALLYNLWDQDRENIELFLRLFSECWYLLCEWEVEEGTKGLSWDAFRDTLIECTTYGLEHFNQDIRFLWLGGYMISMFPYLFYRDESDEDKSGALYLKWESKGNEMSEKAARQEPNNLLAKLNFVGSYQFVTANGNDEYLETKKRLAPFLGKYFPGDTIIEEYFREIYS